MGVVGAAVRPATVVATATAVRRSLLGFSPAALFANGEQGAWYDPSDLSTLFQDAAGTIPAALDQPVGLMLDKRLGLVRGVELIVPNTWTMVTGESLIQQGNGFTVVNTATGINTRAAMAFATTPGATYEVSYTKGVGAGPVACHARQGAIPGTGTVIYTNISSNPSRFTFVAVTAASNILFDLSTISTYTISGVSVRELPGNHASQSTAAARPVLSARKNLLTYSEDLTNAAWAKTGINVGSRVSGFSPVIGTDTTTSPRLIANSATASLNAPYTLTINLKPGVKPWVAVTLFDVASRGVRANVNLDTGAVGARTDFNGPIAPHFAATRLSDGTVRVVCGITAGTEGVLTARCYSLNADDAVFNGQVTPPDAVTPLYYFGNSQIEPGPAATRYQRVTTDTDYDAQGFPHYLKFDGVDDILATSSIDFTATDKMTVFAGVRKLSDAVVGIIAELTLSSVVNNGAFGLWAASDSFAFRSRGSIQSSDNAGGISAPATRVLTCIADISGDVARIRCNGVAGAGSLSDQGVGNYSNATLFIGERGGAESFPLNGYIYGLIVRGAQSTAAQIASVERYLATKAGVALP